MGVGRVGLFVYSKSPLDLQILASHVLSLTLIFIVHSFRESSLDSFRSHQPHCGLPCRFEETGSPFWVTHPLEWSAIGKVVLFYGLHCRCDKRWSDCGETGEGTVMTHKYRWWGFQKMQSLYVLAAEGKAASREIPLSTSLKVRPPHMFLIFSFLKKKKGFVKLPLLIIARNNAGFHTKKFPSYYQKG